MARRVVFDTNILISGYLWKGPPRQAIPQACRRIVDDDQDRSGLVRRLGELAAASGTQIYVWALMSNTPIFYRAAAC